MNQAKQKFYENQAASIIKKLQARKMEGFYCQDIQSAKAKVLELIGEGAKSVAYGGSMTLDESGIKDDGDVLYIKGCHADAALVGQAFMETDDPAEGDYIRYQYGGYTVSGSCEIVDGKYKYTVAITPKYYMYLAQEEQVTEKLAELMPAFGFDENTTDYEKIRAIYDYVCTHVRYDKVHRRNEHHHAKSTAYAALVRGTATCQGYCVLLYRMLRDNGINCRVVTGTATGESGSEFHAWNMAELDGQYYYLDATWDAGKPAEAWSCFLKGSEGFADHVPDPQFRSPAFTAGYPVSREDAVTTQPISDKHLFCLFPCIPGNPRPGPHF